jgi:NAD(P)H-flavin reductase/hemoglobin-like flavoprotein
MEYFFARLFVASPPVRALFPLSMARTRVGVYLALTKLIGNLDDPDATRRALSKLGGDHRMFGVMDKHYQPFFDALLATVEHAAGTAWTTQAHAAWRCASGYFLTCMAAGAAQDARQHPAWWLGEIVQHDQRTPTIAVLTIRPDRPLDYRPGQYVPVQVPQWPRVWRSYSVANAPTGSGLIDLHVRAVPGGMVSTALVSRCGAGDMIVLGAPRGELAGAADAGRSLLCVAGGTGLAPVKAIIESVIGAAPGRPRSVCLYFGVRRRHDLYDTRDLEALQLGCPLLEVISVVEHDLLAAVLAHPSFRDTDVCVSGPAGLVRATARALAGLVPVGRLWHDPLEALAAAIRPHDVGYAGLVSRSSRARAPTPARHRRRGRSVPGRPARRLAVTPGARDGCTPRSSPAATWRSARTPAPAPPRWRSRFAAMPRR